MLLFKVYFKEQIGSMLFIDNLFKRQLFHTFLGYFIHVIILVENVLFYAIQAIMTTNTDDLPKQNKRAFFLSIFFS